MEKKIIVAPIGEDLDSLFVGIKNFPTDKLILITDNNSMQQALIAKEAVEKFKIQVAIKEIKSMNVENIFECIAEIKQIEDNTRLIINSSAGNKFSSCAVTCAGYVNAIKSFFVIGDDVVVLPILRFSYYKLLTDKKMELLKMLYKNENCCSSLEELSQTTKMSLPLVSYYINGSINTEGLEAMGLVDVEKVRGKIHIRLSTLGRMLVKGYIPSEKYRNNKKEKVVKNIIS